MFTNGDCSGPTRLVRVHQTLSGPKKLFDVEDIDHSQSWDLSLCYYSDAGVDKDMKIHAINAVLSVVKLV